MENKVEGKEVSDLFEASEIYAGLSHAYQIKVMQVLVQLGERLNLRIQSKNVVKISHFFVSSPWVRHISRSS